MLDDIDHNNYAKTLVVKMLLNTTQGIQLTELSARHRDATTSSYPHLPPPSKLALFPEFPCAQAKKATESWAGPRNEAAFQ